MVEAPMPPRAPMTAMTRAGAASAKSWQAERAEILGFRRRHDVVADVAGGEFAQEPDVVDGADDDDLGVGRGLAQAVEASQHRGAVEGGVEDEQIGRLAGVAAGGGAFEAAAGDLDRQRGRGADRGRRLAAALRLRGDPSWRKC